MNTGAWPPAACSLRACLPLAEMSVYSSTLKHVTKCGCNREDVGPCGPRCNVLICAFFKKFFDSGFNTAAELANPWVPADKARRAAAQQAASFCGSASRPASSLGVHRVAW